MRLIWNWNDCILKCHFGISSFYDVFLSEFLWLELCESLTQFRTVFPTKLILWTSRYVFWVIILVEIGEWYVLFIGSDCCVLGRCDKGIWDITRLRWSELFGIVYRLNLLCNGITSRGLRKLLDFARDIVIWSR